MRKNGAMISIDGNTVSLAAPVVVDATTLKGDRRAGVDRATGPTARIVPRRAAMTKCPGRT
jgi:hypothetical protein